MPKPKKGKVLVILTDQQRWDCVGYAGNEDIYTPHLDRLREQSTNYERTYCPFPVCTPSRYSLLSGLYVHQHGGDTNSCTLGRGHTTFPRELKKAGYHTKAVGKMHFRPTYLDVGYDEMILAEQCGPGRLEDDYHRELMEAGLVDVEDCLDQVKEFRDQAPGAYWENFGALPSSLPEEWHSTKWIGDRAVESLREWADESELLTVSFIKPHHPFDPPQRWADYYAGRKVGLLEGWLPSLPDVDNFKTSFLSNEQLTEDVMERITRYYYATISHIDEQVGRMTAVLEESGHLEDTTIVFTSDHGEYLGFHHMVLKGGHLYEPLMRVPLLIKERGQKEAKSSDILVSLIDIAPTILEEQNVAVPESMKGLRLHNPEKRDAVFAEAWAGSAYMVRTGRYKLIYARESGESLLFDLETDPFERTNLYGDAAHAEVEKDLKEKLLHWILFDHCGPTYRDDEAPVIQMQDGQEAGEGVRRARLEYFRGVMKPHLREEH